MSPMLSWDLLRFGIVSAIGLGFDLSTAWALAVFAGIPLAGAASVGVLVGAIVNYLLHETWTFRSNGGRLSGRRWLLYMATLAVTLLVRAGVIAVLQLFVLTGAGHEFTTLSIAIGTSFAVNYLLSKYLVFRAGTEQVI
ncbi:GtrA family protein [Rhodopseudomonas sp. HC1]|uniref:GtrA family protein n=1 Tax=Rhodopseudomonas infernalis TaxID=2897386 RepID=UPI001EE8EDF2|nr:GtrA family protein [Rhodopseudomonas infernalis]MCG6206878.1 GtrA family protein [Rhodopseudomonas infernalis]